MVFNYIRFWTQFNFFIQYYFFFNFIFLIKSFYEFIVYKTQFLVLYYIRSEYVWQDGFLFDFLQKKTADAWVRQFVIYTGFLFSERLVFENVVRFYIDYLVWPLHNFSIFETKNVSEMLNIIIYIILTFLLLYVSLYILILL